jgi:hypothetical protein
VERAFPEVRRPTSVAGRFPDEMPALALIYGVLEGERLRWRRVTMRTEDIVWSNR